MGKETAREQITKAALEIVRAENFESLTARALGKKLGSSACPIFTVFENMEDVQQAVFEAVRDVYKGYVEKGKFYGSGESRFQALKNISLKIENGDFVVILGASGSGKSTLLNVISGLERPENGQVIYDGKDITTLSDSRLTEFRKENIGFIFQQYYLLPNMNILKNVKMGADLAANKDYKAVIEAVGLKSRRFCSLTNQRVHWTSKLADRCLTIFVNCKSSIVSQL